MDIREFVDQCNKTPLLKDYRKKNNPIITETILEEVGFLKNVYVLTDLVVLTEKLTGFVPPEEPPELEIVHQKKRGAKDLIHLQLMRTLDNQKLIAGFRKELDMPFPNRGFKIVKNDKFPLAENFNNTNFGFSPEFEKWFFREAGGTCQKISLELWEKISNALFIKIENTVKNIIAKWELPPRYVGAVRELVLFNRIIPAVSGINWTARPDAEGNWKEGIEYDPDVTKDDLLNTITEDSYEIFRKRKQSLNVKNRRSKRNDPNEIKKMLDIYNKYRSSGKKSIEIFKIIRNKLHPELSLSAIRKRIKGK